MKLLKLFFVALGCVLFASCLEINEEVEIKQNGSGQLSTTMDMGQLVDMMQAMGGEEFEKKKGEKLDSVIYLKDIVDTSKNLTADQKRLMRDGTVRVQMDMAEKLFKLNMQYPFTSLETLQKLHTAVGDGGFGFGSIMKDAMGGKDKGDESGGLDAPVNSETSEMDQLMGIFDYNISNGLIKKTVNPEKLKALMNNPKMAEMQQGAEMGIEVMYKVSYKLPRPVKRVDNPKAKISDDKKTVTLRGNLMEIFTKPEQFAFTIEY
ncbi:MAG TPA: hypothetical protein VFZ47_00105 [Chitinophagaceae bacterium]